MENNGPFKVFKILFGDIPSQWFRLLVLGGCIVWAFYAVRNFERTVMQEAQATRVTLTAYIASNEAWQKASNEERAVLLRKVNTRLKRLYQVNGWDYEDVER